MHVCWNIPYMQFIMLYVQCLSEKEKISLCKSAASRPLIRFIEHVQDSHYTHTSLMITHSGSAIKKGGTNQCHPTKPLAGLQQAFQRTIAVPQYSDWPSADDERTSRQTSSFSPWLSAFVSLCLHSLRSEVSVLQCCWLAEIQWLWREAQGSRGSRGSRAEPVILYTSQTHCTGATGCTMLFTKHERSKWDFNDVCRLDNSLNAQIFLSERFSHCCLEGPGGYSDMKLARCLWDMTVQGWIQHYRLESNKNIVLNIWLCLASCVFFSEYAVVEEVFKSLTYVKTG